jgi:hypothetical protein
MLVTDHKGSLMLLNDPADLSRTESRIVVELKRSVDDLRVGADPAGLDPPGNESQNKKNYEALHFFDNFTRNCFSTACYR